MRLRHHPPLFILLVTTFSFVAPTTRASAESNQTTEELLEVDIMSARCGFNCCFLALEVLGKRTDYQQLLARMLSIDPDFLTKGSRLDTIRDILEEQGLYTRAVETSLFEVGRNGFPAIVYIEHLDDSHLGHFVFMFTNDLGELRIADPPNPILPGDADRKERVAALLVSRSPIPVRPTWRAIILLLPFAGLGIGGGWVAGRLACRRTKT